jgi:predicted nucleic acid-binding protein
VLFSAIGWAGKPRRCLEFARTGRIEAVTCEQIIEELAEKLKQKLNFSDRQVLETSAYLMGFMRAVAIPGTLRGASPDPDDDMVLECAAAAGATQVVSGDKKHLLSLKQFRGISILSPAELVQRVEAATT